MKHGHFRKSLDDAQIVAAIHKAEKRCSGEIRVFVTRRQPADILGAAQTAFDKLGMSETAERNGVLLFIAPKIRKFAIVGDKGVHEKCGQSFWDAVVAEMSAHLRENRFTEALVAGIERAGEELGRHFPHQRSDRNELPDDVVRD